MGSIDVRPSTLEGIKRLAKSIKRQHAVTHTNALDLAAGKAGFANFRHARNLLATTPPATTKGTSPLLITAYWRDQEGQKGRETLRVSLHQQWATLLRPQEMRGARGLAAFRKEADDHIETREDIRNQEAARRKVCEAARSLQFMEATGLRPLTGRYPRRLSDLVESLPRRDHPSTWINPKTGALFFVDEPYSAGDELLLARQEWATDKHAAVGTTTWLGMYNPPGSTMFFTCFKDSEDELGRIVKRLDAEPPPVDSEAWTGESAPYYPLLISPARSRSGINKRGRPVPKYVGMVRGKAVVYGNVLAGGCWRPDARMPLEAHKQAANHLKELLGRGGLRSRAYYRIDHVRSELDEWVQREYGRADLPDDVFHSLYYGRVTSSDTEPMDLVQSVERLLLDHYPDCVPRRDMLRCLTTARRDLDR